MTYLGHLPISDPLYGYLRYDILPQMGVDGTIPDFRVYTINASNHVCLYKDCHSHAHVIGKFFGGNYGCSSESAFRRMEREFNNINHLRSLGFTGYPHYIVRPLGYNPFLNCVLVEEFCYGTSLTDFILKAIRDGAGNILFQKLTALAYFLATMHNRTAQGVGVDFDQECSYFDMIIGQLRDWGHIGWEESQEFYWLKDRWREKDCVWEDQKVLVHGDITPTNVLFGDGLWVIVVDLERMKKADRVFDVGCVAGELKHFFMQYAGNDGLAEPFIGHFLWEYACHFPNRHRAFDSITRRVPFYMGLTLLRIARNSWLGNEYRRHLLEQAQKTLR